MLDGGLQTSVIKIIKFQKITIPLKPKRFTSIWGKNGKSTQVKAFRSGEDDNLVKEDMKEEENKENKDKKENGGKRFKVNTSGRGTPKESKRQTSVREKSSLKSKSLKLFSLKLF